ncbi:serine/threonine-protein kinase [Roseofilum casamattae]|uniref:Serine/threonine-protein kinase n=1 Tax=Roseofilum casamattae BLCC-M143 TaxID=3022442 RepID=A0ABT7BS84_9CYAN|nr:serine/threonine-protein kinase [Roseofilum casamattae]MDJ1182053.1 serine/threonine-protein kinase [Roseofilum casamattae BLCC-M143]
MDWKPGREIAGGKYRIEKSLGEGGFGITYKAQHLTLGSFCVIKTPNLKLRQDARYPEFVQRFHKEAKTLANLKPHPHIVRVFDLFSEPEGGNSGMKVDCLMMEFIEGESLYHLVRRRGALPEKQAVGYIRQIGSALSHIHETGLVHFDATPLNIMIRSDGTAILIDFGIAGDCPPSTMSLAANPAFAPYKQLFGEREITGDIYTLAAGLYYMVTGELPTPAGKRKRNKPFIQPREHRAISANLNYAIVWAMELEAENRPQSIQEWLRLPCFSGSVPQTVDLGAPVAPQPQTQPTIKLKANQPATPIPTKNVNLPPQGDDLSSERGIDYRRLQRLLQQQRWKDADEETERRMLEATKREKDKFLRDEDAENFPRADLRTIDRLWVTYSQGQFGFSVQKQIWLDSGGKLGRYDSKIWEKFCDRVGWRKNGEWLIYNDCTFNTNALQGHLPARLFVGLFGGCRTLSIVLILTSKADAISLSFHPPPD